MSPAETTPAETTPAETTPARPSRPDVSIVIPVFNKLELTRACVAAIHRETARGRFEIIVVNNGSSDGTAAWLRDEEAAGRLSAVANPENRGFAQGCNLGADAARGRYILFLNNDTEVEPGWLEPVVTTLDADPEVGVVGSRLLFPDRTIQHGGVVLVDFLAERVRYLGGRHMSYRKPADFPGANQPLEMQVVTGACLAIRPELFRAAGGFDEGFWNGNEDVDLCLKVGQRGARVVYRPESVVIHYESQSGKERHARTVANIVRLEERWRGVAEPDYVQTEDDELVETAHCRIRQYYGPRLREIAPRGDDAQVSDRQTDISVIVREGKVPLDRAAALAGTAKDRDDIAALEMEWLAVPRIGSAAGAVQAVNAGLAAARGRDVVVVDADHPLEPGWLAALIAASRSHDRRGIVAAVPTKAADVPAGDPAPAATGEPAPGCDRVLAPPSVALLIRGRVLARLGGWDPALEDAAVAATDYCWRANIARFHVVTCAAARFGPAEGETGASGSDASRSGASGSDASGPAVAGPGCASLAWQRLGDLWGISGRVCNMGDVTVTDLFAQPFNPLGHFVPLSETPHRREIPPANFEVAQWLDDGEALFARGHGIRAERTFAALLRWRPDLDRARNDLAVCLWQRGEIAAAEAMLRELIRRSPDDADAHWNLEQLHSAQALSG